MSTIIGKTVRRRRRKQTAILPDISANPELTNARETTNQLSTKCDTTFAVGRILCEKMVSYPSSVKPHPDNQRRPIPEWVSKEDTELFHAFCVANDVLGTSYRPLECRYLE